VSSQLAGSLHPAILLQASDIFSTRSLPYFLTLARLASFHAKIQWILKRNLIGCLGLPLEEVD
jgi:hypothetical protein